MKRIKKKVLLFDLGGVLVELGQYPFPLSWFETSKAATLSDWFKSKTALDFEQGLISPDEFAIAIKKELNLTVTTTQIIDQFTLWPIGLYAQAHELLLDLKSRYELVALTNTNALHWPRLVNEFKLPQYFSTIFASHLINLAKPQQSAFIHVIEQLNVCAGDIIFFDDNVENVRVANQLGMTAFQVKGIDELKQKLRQENIVEDSCLI